MVGFITWLVLVAATLFAALFVASRSIVDKSSEYLANVWNGKVSQRFYVVGLRGKITMTAIFAMLIPVFFSPLYYEFPSPPDKMFVFNEQDNMAERHWGAFEWENYAWVPWARMSAASSKRRVSVITENPKVREVSYEISGYVTDPKKYLKNPERRMGYISVKMSPDSVNGYVTRRLDYLVYEFNNERSKDLAQFYNPKDEKQQQRFKELVETWFNERISEIGIKVRVSDFSL